MLDEYGDDPWGKWAQENVEELMVNNYESRAGGAKTLEATRQEARQIQEKNNKRKRKNCLLPAVGLLGIAGAIGVIATNVIRNLP